MLRFFSFLLLVFLCTSCNKISLFKKETDLLDASIDFTKVDTPPVLYNCKNLIGKEKEECFEETIQEVFNNTLSKIALDNDSLVNIKFTIKLSFNKKKQLFFDIESNNGIFIPQSHICEEAIKKAVSNLRYIYPATKQGVPVTTVYKLPIEIIYSD